MPAFDGATGGSIEVAEVQVGGHAEPIVLEAGPVEAGAAVEMVLAVGADHDVVAAFADQLRRIRRRR